MKSTAEYIALLQQFKENNAEKYGIRRLGLFGSVARGEQRDDSDLDIYIEGEPQSLFTMSHLKNELQELLECKVDVVRLRDRMNSLLKKRIEKEGIYV
jgi:predicted nucleotidyltransferase